LLFEHLRSAKYDRAESDAVARKLTEAAATASLRISESGTHVGVAEAAGLLSYGRLRLIGKLGPEVAEGFRKRMQEFIDTAPSRKEPGTEGGTPGGEPGPAPAESEMPEARAAQDLLSKQEAIAPEDASFDFGANIGEPAPVEGPRCADAEQASKAQAWVDAMRSKERVAEAQPWIDYCSGKLEKRPQIRSKLEQEFADKFGVVDPWHAGSGNADLASVQNTQHSAFWRLRSTIAAYYFFFDFGTKTGKRN
jgi:hypothetical protein